MKKGPPPDFVRDRNGNVTNRLRKQKAKTKKGRKIVRYLAALSDGRRKYFVVPEESSLSYMRSVFRNDNFGIANA